jgi:hypothetical protein
MASRHFFAATLFLMAAGSPVCSQISLSERVVVVTAPNGATITGQVCNYSTEECVEIEGKQGTAHVALALEDGDLAGFSGTFDEVQTDIVEAFSLRSNFDWLERAALVLAGAIAGLFGNILMAWYADNRKDRVEQRSKFRSWRDAVLAKIKQRQNGEGVKFAVEIPDGLSKRTSKKIHGLETQLLSIENKLHAQPDQAEKLLVQARKLFVHSSV